MKTALEWYRELYQRSGGATEAEIAAIQADALDGLRDRFACAALTGLLMQRDAVFSHEASEAARKADVAYTLADAMIVRRAQQTTASLEEAKQTVPHE